jgi:membrane fusion protein (multidrug efflux system)
MKRGFRYGAVAVVLAGLAGGAVFYRHYAEQPAVAQSAAPDSPDPDSSTPQAAAMAMPVETAKVAVDTVVSAISAIGTLQSSESVVLGPEIAGRISEIRFKEGERVEAGDVLVKLDTEVLEATLAQARANLTLSKANYDRAKTLASQGTGTVRARDEALAQWRTDTAIVALAEARLAKATIRAPFSGTLGLRSVSVGAYVTPGERIVNLEQTDPLKVDFQVPEIYLARVHEGQTIEVTVDARPGEVFKGEIYAIDPKIDVGGRAIRLRARIPNPEGRLSPGLFTRVSIIAGKRDDAILVPESALVPRQDGKFVYRVQDGKAVLTKVETGERRPGQVEILEGLGPDATVVTAGQQRLQDGTPVEVVTAVAGR